METKGKRVPVTAEPTIPRRPALLCVPLLLLAAGCGGGEPSTPSSGGRCSYVAEGSAATDVNLPPSDPEPAGRLTITTNRGDIPVSLDGEGRPCTTGSFTSLAQQGFFDHTSCHRLTTQGIYVLQCGDPTGSGSGGPGYRFDDELTGEETYEAGTLAMANAGPDTNGSQFFIVYADSQLPQAYTVFGAVDPEGLKVVRDVARAGSDDSNGPGDGAPKEDVVIETVG